MESRAGGDIHVHVGVVHPVKAPERRHVMKDPVLEVNRQIHCDDAGDDCDPRRPSEMMKQPQAMRFGKQSKSNRSGRRNDPSHQRVQRRHTEIVWPTPGSGNRPFPSCSDSFPQRHQGQDAKEDAQANQRFEVQVFFGHARHCRLIQPAER
jgi:hypothetical protein